MTTDEQRRRKRENARARLAASWTERRQIAAREAELEAERASVRHWAELSRAQDDAASSIRVCEERVRRIMFGDIEGQA